MITDTNLGNRAQAGAELRRSPRRTCQWPVRVRAPNSQILLQVALNASADGVMLDLEFKPHLGATLLMKFEAMHQGVVLDFAVKGRVCHVVVKKHTYHTGVEFIDPPEQFQRFLQAFVNKEI